MPVPVPIRHPHHAETPERPHPLSAFDAAAIVCLCVVLLLLSYLRSRQQMFWGDEIMGLYTLRQPTFHDLLRVWRFGLDSSGIWFYVLGRPWIAIFGSSEIALRMFSATGIAASAAVLWIACRRFYNILPVAAAITCIYAFLPAMRWQLANGRTYGILMLAVATVIYLIFRGEDAPAAKPTPLFLLATFAAYSFLAGSHILGALYIATFLAMQISIDLSQHRLRIPLYLSAACSLVVVLFSRANIHATAALGKPSFWTVPPTLKQLVIFNVVLGSKRIPAVIFAILVIALLEFTVSRGRRPIYVILIAFLALDLFLFAFSRYTTSIYVDRYVLPFAVFGILLLCELLTQTTEATRPIPLLQHLVAPAMLLVGLAGLALPRLQHPFFPFPDYTAHLLASVPAGIPVIDADVSSFVDVEFYHRGRIPEPFLFPTDWQSALSPDNRGGVSGFHEMDNFKTLGIDAASIQPSAEILSQYKNFTVIVPASNVWFRQRILADPHFTATHASTFEDNIVILDIWNVRRNP